MKESNKVVPVHVKPSARPHCLVYFLDKYFSNLLPEEEIWMCSTCTAFPRNLSMKINGMNIVQSVKKKLRRFMEVVCRKVGMSEKKPNIACVLQVLRNFSVLVFLKN